MKNNMRLITVIMGSETSEIRNKETTEMLDYGFAQYKLNTLLTKNSEVGKIEVTNGEKENVSVIPKEDITFLSKKMDKDKNLTYDIKLNKVSAPLVVGDKVGKVTVYEDKKKIKEVDLTIKEDINKVNFLDYFIRNLSKILIAN